SPHRLVGRSANIAVVEDCELVLLFDAASDFANGRAGVFLPENLGAVFQFLIDGKKARQPFEPPGPLPPGRVPTLTAAGHSALGDCLAVRDLTARRPDENRVLPCQAAAIEVRLVLVVVLEPLDERCNPPTSVVAILVGHLGWPSHVLSPPRGRTLWCPAIRRHSCSSRSGSSRSVRRIPSQEMARDLCPPRTPRGPPPVNVSAATSGGRF